MRSRSRSSSTDRAIGVFRGVIRYVCKEGVAATKAGHAASASTTWLNQVEGWFSILQGQSLTGASFTSVEQLKNHIDAFIESYNEDAEPFVWTKSKVHQRRVKGRRLSDL